MNTFSQSTKYNEILYLANNNDKYKNKWVSLFARVRTGA